MRLICAITDTHLSDEWSRPDVTVACCSCSRPFPLSATIVDLDGLAFQAYYCLPCFALCFTPEGPA